MSLLTYDSPAPVGGFSRRTALCLFGALSVVTVVGCASSRQSVPRKVAFVGAGRMGTALGTLFAAAGYEVMLSSRHPEELKPLVDRLGNRARAGTVAEAVNFGDIIILTLPYNGVPDVVREFGETLSAKPLVIDVGNPVALRDGAMSTAVIEKGAGLYLQELMPKAKIVRAFNAMNWEKIPEYATRQGANKVAAPILGNDKNAIALAEGLIRDIGFEPVLVGGLAMSRHTAPRTSLADDHTAAEVRRIAADLK